MNQNTLILPLIFLEGKLMVPDHVLALLVCQVVDLCLHLWKKLVSKIVSLFGISKIIYSHLELE